MVLPLLATAGKFALGAAKNPVVQTGVASLLGGLFGGGDKGVELEDLRTKEQKEAQAALQSLGTTGTFGDLTLGQAYGGPLGEFKQTVGERQALEQLQGLFGGPDITQARQTLTDLAQTQFDPSDPRSGFGAFQRSALRAQQEASDILNREAAATGGRFGTAIAGEKAELAARTSDVLQQQLANLFQQSRQQQLAGAQGLQSLVQTQAGLAGQIQQQSAIERQLKDEAAKAQLSEFKRQRGEQLARIDILSQEASRNPYLGVSELPGSPSPFSSLANSVLGAVGKSAGSDIGSKLGGLFSSSGGGASVLSSGSSLASKVQGFGGGVSSFNKPSLSSLLSLTK